jgi:hypothetical protein
MEEEDNLTYEEIMEILQQELTIMNAEDDEDEDEDSEYKDLDFNN